ncbi:MAG: Rpn family recombination-promoting nuclease/putative transposase [Alkalinema sp. FL-bin-369]|nr:Rpn family recombination-promoting nuclease/putative transposase [Leptolyngbyaceae cyanobacterium LF-bin-369]
MIFINPKTDFAFKKIFGSEQSQEILISFLNGILYDGENVIQSVDILNPYQAPRIRGMKDTFLDVKATLSGGQTVIIEMQVLNVEGFEQQVLYNAAKAFSTQLNIGQDYTLLSPVIALTITDFEMFQDLDAVISRFVLKEKQDLTDYAIDGLELVFVELPKFHQALNQVDGLTEQWIYFLQNARQLESVPVSMGNVPAIQQAFTVANQANLSREELEDLESREMFIHDQRNAIVKGVKQGRTEGRTEGLAEGLAEGLKQGTNQTKIAIAQRLFTTLDDATIARITDLTLDEVKQLRWSARAIKPNK